MITSILGRQAVARASSHGNLSWDLAYIVHQQLDFTSPHHYLFATSIYIYTMFMLLS